MAIYVGNENENGLHFKESIQIHNLVCLQGVFLNYRHVLDHLYPRLDELPDSHLGRYTEGGCANPLGGWFKDPMMTGYLLVHGNPLYHRNYIEFKKIWAPWNPLELDPGPNSNTVQGAKKMETMEGKKEKIA